MQQAHTSQNGARALAPMNSLPESREWYAPAPQPPPPMPLYRAPNLDEVIAQWTRHGYHVAFCDGVGVQNSGPPGRPFLLVGGILAHLFRCRLPVLLPVLLRETG